MNLKALLWSGILASLLAGCTIEEASPGQVATAGIDTPATLSNDTVPRDTVPPDTVPAAYSNGGEPEPTLGVDASTSEAFTAPPPLVSVDPNVYVVENYDYPVYYVDSYYWEYRAGTWYRSDYWDAPWVQVGVDYVPGYIVHYDHRRWVHYHAPHGVAVIHEPHDHHGGGEVFHHHDGAQGGGDHRSPARPTAVDRTPASPQRLGRGAEPVRALAPSPPVAARNIEDRHEAPMARPAEARSPEPRQPAARPAEPRPVEARPEARPAPRNAAPPVRRAPAVSPRRGPARAPHR